MRGVRRGAAELPPGAARDLVDLFRRLSTDGPPPSPRKIARKTALSPARVSSAGYISEVLRGLKIPGPDLAEAIARALQADDETAMKARQLAEAANELKRYRPPLPTGGQQVQASGPDREAAASDAGKPRARLASAVLLPRSSSAPSRLLDPDRGVVGFTGREAELASLLAWCQGEAAGRLRLITGPGGVGKTRLALQLAERLRAQGWRCEQVGDRQEAQVLTAIRAVTSGRVLLVVDYAETRIDLAALLRDVVLDQGMALRVLLLARTAGQWWQQLGAGEGAIRDLIEQAGPDGSPLGEVLDERLTDEELVRAAVPVFAEALDTAQPEYVVITRSDRRARALELHAAALVAVLEWMAAPGVQVRVDLAGALGELLKHEERYWQGSAGASGLLAGRDGMTLLLLRQIVAAGCLLGAADQHEALDLLERVPQAEPSAKVAQWLRELYPPDAGSGEWLGTLQPDRLAERLVVGELSNSESLAQACLADLDERQGRRAVLLLARAATEDDIAKLLLGRLLPLVAKVVEDIDAPLETLMSISNAIPYPSVALATAFAMITRRILEADPAGTHPAAHARWLIIRGSALNQAGQFAEAFSVTQEAVDIYTGLAAEHPGRFRPDLADALCSLGIHYSDPGRRVFPPAAAKEAVSIYRELAAQNPDRYNRDLARALANLAVRNSEADRPAEALASSEEALSIQRELAAQNSALYANDIATSLCNLSNALLDMKRLAESIRAAQEALRIIRGLAAKESDKYLPDLAGALYNLAHQYLELNRPGDAFPYAEEALGIRRELATTNTVQHRYYLACSLSQMGTITSKLGRHADALSRQEEAVSIYRELAATYPDRYRRNLANSMSDLGVRYSEMDCPAEAISIAQEAVQACRELSTVDAEFYRPELALALYNLGAIFARFGHLAEALPANEETLSLHRELAARAPEKYRSELIRSLSSLGNRYSSLRRHDEAIRIRQEAVSLCREAAAIEPDIYRHDFADSLSTLGLAFWSLGDLAEATSAIQEALGIHRELVAADPERYRADLANSLSDLGFILAESNRPDDALPLAEEGLRIFRQLAADDPGRYRREMARSLRCLADVYSDQARMRELLPIAEEATGIYRELAAGDPGRYRLYVGDSLGKLALALREIGRVSEARPIEKEAARIRRELAAEDSGRRRPGALVSRIGRRLRPARGRGDG